MVSTALCRYNKKGFNVPFGSYKKPYFPEKELWAFAEKAQKATFICESYADAMARAEERLGDLRSALCPLSHHGEFHHLFGGRFHPGRSGAAGQAGSPHRRPQEVPVLISNHDTPG